MEIKEYEPPPLSLVAISGAVLIYSLMAVFFPIWFPLYCIKTYLEER